MSGGILLAKQVIFSVLAGVLGDVGVWCGGVGVWRCDVEVWIFWWIKVELLWICAVKLYFGCERMRASLSVNGRSKKRIKSAIMDLEQFCKQILSSFSI